MWYTPMHVIASAQQSEYLQALQAPSTHGAQSIQL